MLGVTIQHLDHTHTHHSIFENEPSPQAAFSPPFIYNTPPPSSQQPRALAVWSSGTTPSVRIFLSHKVLGSILPSSFNNYSFFANFWSLDSPPPPPSVPSTAVKPSFSDHKAKWVFVAVLHRGGR